LSKIQAYTTILLALVLGLALSVGAAPDQPELTVFCAASLTGAFDEIGEIYEDASGVPVVLNFDGTQALRTQVEQGAYADVFVSANQKHMTALMAEGLVNNDSVTLFAKNSLVVVVPKDNPASISTLDDLAKPGVKIVMGTKDVPVGSYALLVLDKMAEDPDYRPEYRERVMSNVVSRETTVAYVVSKVALGEADAGFAYKSDVTPELSEQVQKIPIPEEYNVVAE
jgi:molybdate transport system substrate-binding protein